MLPSNPVFAPSQYQRDIFDFIERGRGDAQVAACAGSGKTTTLVEAVKRLPQSLRYRTLMLAYNSHIKEELQRRAPEGVTVLTNHALGQRALRQFFQPGDPRAWVEKYKYRQLVRYYWSSTLSVDEPTEAQDTACELLRFCMVTLTDPSDADAVRLMADRYGVDIDPAMEDTILAALPYLRKWGIEGLPTKDRDGKTYHPKEHISFDDMIYLPHQVQDQGCRIPQYQLILVDEAQDLSRAQLATVLAARAPGGGRIVFVGDENQAIYAFSGADAQSFRNIRTETNARVLPLSICYRCPRRVVEKARTLQPWCRTSAR
jgi:superfamily I DNA/RNA helicase